jgi:sulfhydrogenase subunit alpha
MTETRRFTVKPLSRVEGEGALRVRVQGDAIEIAEFNIYEPPRFFERLLVGTRCPTSPHGSAASVRSPTR